MSHTGLAGSTSPAIVHYSNKSPRLHGRDSRWRHGASIAHQKIFQVPAYNIPIHSSGTRIYIYIYSFIRYIPIDFSVRNQVHDVRIQPFIAILTSPHDSTTVTLGGGMVRLLRAMIGWIRVPTTFLIRDQIPYEYNS